MSTNVENNVDQEIDLSVLAKKISGFYEAILSWIFGCILSAKRNAKFIIGLLILGLGLGTFLDKTNNSYRSEIIVSPNMGGTDYLYSKIDLLKSKLEEGDEAFFKNIGINNPDKISLIDVKPIIDIYSFVNNSTSAASAQNTQNFELIKLLAETSSVEKVIKDKITSKNYPHHAITINTIGQTKDDETVKPLIKYLNTDAYLNQILNVSKENIKIKMKKNEELIAQTDSLIRILTFNLTKNQKSSNLVYNNENNQFNSFFDLKNSLINEIGSQKIQLINNNAIIKDISIVTNIRETKDLNGKMKFLLPILFLFLFFGGTILVRFYKIQLAKSKI
jgi:hypothetical protein